MIRHISEFFDTQLAFTGWIEKFFPLVKVVYDGDKGTPNYYRGSSQYIPISNFDNWNGMAYLRLVSNPTITENTEVSNNRACSNGLNFIYPLRLVFCIKRSQLKLDDAFSEERTVNDLIKSLSVKNGSLKRNISAISTSIIPESWTTESVDVVRDEYPGIDNITVNAEFIYGAINFNANILIDKDCITDSCEDPCYAYSN